MKNHPKVQKTAAVLFSGGKDSTFALQWALENNYDVKYLLTVKPTRKDCYLFHYATAEHTRLIARMLKIRHIMISCEIAEPKHEANIIKKVVMENHVEVILLGGVGLQKTQIKSLAAALKQLNTKVLVPHKNMDHDEIIRQMLGNNYKILITQVAGDGLLRWLGKTITKQSFEELKSDSKKYGFHIGFEGGYADTFVLDADFFPEKMEPVDMQKIVDDDYCGHIIIDELKVIKK